MCTPPLCWCCTQCPFQHIDPLLFEYWTFKFSQEFIHHYQSIICLQLSCLCCHATQWSNHHVSIQLCHFVQPILPVLYFFVWIWSVGAFTLPWDPPICSQIHPILVPHSYLVNTIEIIVMHWFSVVCSFGWVQWDYYALWLFSKIILCFFRLMTLFVLLEILRWGWINISFSHYCFTS